MNTPGKLIETPQRVIIEPHYLPNLEFFAAVFPYPEIQVDIHSHFVKQSLRSRSTIATANGTMLLVVPVTNKGNRTPLHEVTTAENIRWRTNHWRTIESAYRNAPFFEYYSDDLRNLILGTQTSLYRLNVDILSICLEWLGWEKKVTLTSEYVQTIDGSDLRNTLEAKIPFTDRPYLIPALYRQVFGSAFAENLSIIDLVFCTGPEASAILQRSIKGN